MEENFWSGDDFTNGINILHTKVAQGQSEHAQIIQLVQEITAIHETFSSSLKAVTAKSSWQKLDQAGFAKDEGGSLKQAFYLIKDQTISMASEHATFATILRENVVESMKSWSEETKKIFNVKKKDSEAGIKALEKQRFETEKKKSTYDGACRLLDEARVKVPGSPSVQSDGGQQSESSPRPRNSSLGSSMLGEKMDIVVNIGNVTLTMDELKSILAQMQSRLTLRELKYPLLGTYRVVSGEDIFYHLQSNLALHIKSAEDAVAFGQGLLDSGHIKLIGQKWGKKFTPKDDWYYQWNKTAEEHHSDKVMDLTRDMEASDRLYRASIEVAEQQRMMYEKQITDHLNFIQNMEISRISAIRQGLHTFSVAVGALAASAQNSSNSMLIALETVNAEKDVKMICERYKTGMLRPSPVIYRNFYQSPAEEQIFGVAIDEYCNHHHARVPWIVAECCDAIEKSLELMDRIAYWMQSKETGVSDVYSNRAMLNRPIRLASEEIIDKASPSVIIAVLRRYFMELPVSLIPSEEYDSLKVLYFSKSEESETAQRLKSVINIFSQIPKSHFEALKYTVSSFHRTFFTHGGFVDPASLESYPHMASLTEICAHWGSIVLRPAVGSASFDRHPERLLRDLIVHHETIFVRQASSPVPSQSTVSNAGSSAPRLLSDEFQNVSLNENMKPPGATKLENLNLRGVADAKSGSSLGSSLISPLSPKYAQIIEDHADLPQSVQGDAATEESEEKFDDVAISSGEEKFDSINILSSPESTASDSKPVEETRATVDEHAAQSHDEGNNHEEEDEAFSDAHDEVSK